MSGKALVPSAEQIEHAILFVREQKVLLDRNLAELYAVKAIALRQQVKRNADRFPPDFMLQLSENETKMLVSQNVIPSRRRLGGSRPYAFTQEGIAMLSSVLRSSPRGSGKRRHHAGLRQTPRNAGSA